VIGRQTGTQTETDEERDTQTDRSYDNLIQYLGVIVQMSVCLSQSHRVRVLAPLICCLIICLSLSLSVCLSVCLCVCLTVCVCVCLSVSVSPCESLSTTDMLLNGVKFTDKKLLQQLSRETFLLRSRNMPLNTQVVQVTWLTPFLKHTKQYVTIWVRSLGQPTPETHQTICNYLGQVSVSAHP